MHGDTVDNWFSADTATFGDRLAAAREAAGLSQQELARRLGVRHKTIDQWEHDAAEPRANRLQMLAGMLSVSLMWLLNGEGDGVASPDAAEEAPPVAGLLVELRQLQGELTQISGRIGRVEKRLRGSLKGPKAVGMADEPLAELT